MSTDPARRTLERALAEATARADRARTKTVTLLCGGVPWHSERLAARRDELRRALSDRAIARELLRELDAIDGVAPAEVDGDRVSSCAPSDAP